MRLAAVITTLITLLVAACSRQDDASTAGAPTTTSPGSDFEVPWTVDLDASMAGITAVPSRHRQCFANLEAYKAFVRRSATNLTVTLHANGRATIAVGWDPTTKATWSKDEPGFDYWIHKQGSFGWFGFPIAGVGHGFSRTGPTEARLKFQIEWDDDAATREFLILRLAKK